MKKKKRERQSESLKINYSNNGNISPFVLITYLIKWRGDITKDTIFFKNKKIKIVFSSIKMFILLVLFSLRSNARRNFVGIDKKIYERTNNKFQIEKLMKLKGKKVAPTKMLRKLAETE